MLCLLAGGCQWRHGNAGPSIEFSRVPPADAAGRDQLDIIEGRVVGAKPGQQIILYSRSGSWWVQPLVNQPFTKIQPDSKWQNATHLGTEYAALLVNPAYHPPATMAELPPVAGDVAAVAIAKRDQSNSAFSKILHFSGYDWRVRGAPSDRGGTSNLYSPDNAWTDEKGAMHLRIGQQNDRWTCTEVSLTRSLGYGSYSFVVRDVGSLEPPTVFGMFTWDYSGSDQNHREMDIEISRWNDPASKNAQYVVQPYYVPANVARFTAPSGALTYSFRWEPGRIDFRTDRGAKPGMQASPVSEQVFTSGVPSPGIETVRMNLYVLGKPETLHPTEVVIEKFEYLP